MGPGMTAPAPAALSETLLSWAGRPELEGAVTEERLAFGATVASQLSAGDTVTIAREAIHRVRHAGHAPAVTLHAYSPPLSRVGTYEVAGDGSLLRHPRSPDLPLEAAA
jgi:Cysteine dioxygenase type I